VPVPERVVVVSASYAVGSSFDAGFIGGVTVTNGPVRPAARTVKQTACRVS
jgi:hypothetical protein